MNNEHDPEENYVSLGQGQCALCGELYDTGEVLLDRTMRGNLKSKTVTQHGLCPAHSKTAKDNDIVYLIEVTNTQLSLIHI